MCPKFCTDAKPYKHTQTLTLRKAREIVRFWKGWWSDNPSGSRPNFFGRQHLTFDKGGKRDGAGQGDGCAFEKVVGMERSVGNPAPFGKGAKNVVLSVG